MDYGRDFYAPVSWSDIPESDGRLIWLGWFNNWETCLVPTSPWRSCMSVPRTLTLRRTSALRQQRSEPDTTRADYTLIQRPVREFYQLSERTILLKTDSAAWPPVPVTRPGELTDMNFILEATLKPGRARSCGIRIRTGNDEYTEIGYDREPGVVYVDRRKSGNVDFHPAFAGRHNAPVSLISGATMLTIIVDRSTIEVFINDGEAVISDRIFPNSRTPVIEVLAGDETAKVTNTKLHLLKSIWKK